MNYRLRLVRSAFAVIVTLSFCLLTAGASVAQDTGPASVPDPALTGSLAAPDAIPSGGPGYLSQTAFGFQPYPNQSVPFNVSGRTLYNTDTATHYYQAAVQLPHGATITKFVVWYTDNSTATLWAALARAGLDDSSVAQIGYVTSTGAATGIRYVQDTTIATPLVDNGSYMYWVEVGLPPNSGAGILSFRIDYRYGSALPLISK